MVMVPAVCAFLFVKRFLAIFFLMILTITQ